MKPFDIVYKNREISLKKKKLISGRISLYLEYYKGYSIDDNGKQIHDRSFDYLKIYQKLGELTLLDLQKKLISNIKNPVLSLVKNLSYNYINFINFLTLLKNKKNN